ncbi:MAG TPA: 1-acyl-sn-glycerol-3-phosphate acyltransferase, partial [Polyangiales bacterium]|nr:1-acyl-sn-glycerol-3-phosphate acyltransferase [Polyangiales bacterium]
MTVDGFRAQDKEATARHDPRVAQFVFERMNRLAERFHFTLEGLDQLPAGRALLVANHAFGWDVLVPMAIIATRLQRRVWVLGEKAWWKVPFVRRFAASVGVVDGTHANADRLLQADELVLVLPGGLREAVKPREL